MVRIALLVVLPVRDVFPQIYFKSAEPLQEIAQESTGFIAFCRTVVTFFLEPEFVTFDSLISMILFHKKVVLQYLKKIIKRKIIQEFVQLLGGQEASYNQTVSGDPTCLTGSLLEKNSPMRNLLLSANLLQPLENFLPQSFFQYSPFSFAFILKYC